MEHHHIVRVFCLISSKWRDERNCGSVELTKNELLVYFNMENSYLEFDKEIKNNKKSVGSYQPEQKLPYISESFDQCKINVFTLVLFFHLVKKV